MRTRTGWICVGLASLVAAAALAGSLGASAERASAAAIRAEADIRERDIAFFTARAARDPYGAADRAHLGRLYLQRARATGDRADFVRAMDIAQRSLALRRDRNGAAYAILAGSLMGLHRFAEALDAAERLLALDPGNAAARALAGEIQLELGRYDAARRSFGMLVTERGQPAVALRLARWEELRGRPEAARALLRSTRERLRGTHLAPAEQQAWFHLRLADLALRHARLAEAGDELEDGLALAPEDPRLQELAARVALARGEPREARAWAERAMARSSDPGVMALLHDASLALGDSATARRHLAAARAAILAEPGLLERDWSMFLLDTGHDVDFVLARTRTELETRQDVFGYDLLGWALYRAGELAAADTAAARALSLGTRDAGMHFHAGTIALARGDTARARRHLATALATNPAWHPRQPAEARAVLERLRRTPMEDGFMPSP